jgi:hypothetical protein
MAIIKIEQIHLYTDQAVTPPWPRDADGKYIRDAEGNITIARCS